MTSIFTDRIRAIVHLPDPISGYYRGTRFDWSGVVASLEWQGHQYFGQWFDEHDPAVHDAITGPVEEFVRGPGYEETEVGGLFLRIGVGAVRKPQEEAYRQFHTYEIADHGTWTVHPAADRIDFVHEMGDTNGYAYVYRKTLRLSGDALIIEHALQNTGRKPLVTPVYNHNFFMLDGQTTGPGLVVCFAFNARAVNPRNDLAVLDGRELTFTRELECGETTFLQVAGHGTSAADYDIRLENRRTGAGVRHTSDRPLSKLLFWAPRTTVCPEPYIDLDVAPGQTTSWQVSYEFYEAGGRP